MTTSTNNHQAIHELLEKALQQVMAAQEQVSIIEGQLHEVKSQVGTSLESIDTVLKQIEAGEQNAEKVQVDVTATLDEMFDHMSRIVNGAREQMLQQRNIDPVVLPSPGGQSEKESTTEEMPAEEIATSETTQDQETPDSEEIAAVEPSNAEQSSKESLSGEGVGQRAAASIDEMMSVIQKNEEAQVSTEIEPGNEAATETKPAAQPETSENELQSDAISGLETEEQGGPGSTKSLGELLAKARAASGTVSSGPTELSPLVEEDAEAVNELLQNAGPFVTQ